MIGRTAIAYALSCIATQAAADFTWGVNGHPLTAYPGIPIVEQIDLVDDLEMTSYRVNISFAEQGDHLGRIIEAAKARGVEILPVLTPGGLDIGTDSLEDIYRKTFAFANELGSRFGDEVAVWELGNEEENYAIIQPCELREDGSQYPCEWGPAGGVDPLDYHGERWDRVSALLRGLSDGLEAAAPDALKAMGTAGWGHLGAFERMRRDGIDWDISVWHIYGEDPEWAFKELAGFHRPIWVTELNHPYGSRDGGEAQADGLVAMMERLLELSATYPVEAAHLYELLDEPYWAPDFEAIMGLASVVEVPDGWMIGPPKPAYAAVRNTIRQAAPARCSDLAASSPAPLPGMQAAYAHCLILGDIKDPTQVRTWAASLAQGDAHPSDMLATLTDASDVGAPDEADGPDIQGDVTRLYRWLLGREADGYSLDSYSEQIASGALTREDLARALVTSEEFLDRHPVFKQPSQEGPSTDPADCDTGEVAALTSNGDRIASYTACLLLSREPDETGLHLWRAAIESGATTTPDLLEAVFRSAVFAARHGTTDLSDEEFVRFAYELLLGRQPDGGGSQGYIERLEAGVLSRDGLLLELSRSGEFAARHPALTNPAGDASQALGPACRPGSLDNLEFEFRKVRVLHILPATWNRTRSRPPELLVSEAGIGGCKPG